MPNEKHIVQSGDTFESISTRYFGEPSQSGRIQSANPGTSVILVPGTVVTIPAAPGSAVGTEAQHLVMRIDGTSFRNVESIVLTRRIDAVDTVEVIAPLAATEPFEDLITPLSYRSLDIADAGELLFRGTAVTVVPSLQVDGARVSIGGYSLPGVLNDCMMPASAYPIEFRANNLADIANKIAEPFSLRVVIEGDMGGPFKRVKLRRDVKLLPFLVGLAQQRQVLIRSNSEGDLVLSEPPKLAGPVADLKQSEPPIKSITPQFSPQSYYSHVTGVRSARRGNRGSQHTVANALLQGVVRPFTISIRDTSKGELPRATIAAMGRVLAKAATYTVVVSTWRDPQGALWTPGTTISLDAPSVFVRGLFKFQLHTVTFSRSLQDGDIATLLLVLPGAFGGEPPSVLPWD